MFDRQAKTAFIVACATLLLCAVGFGAAVKQLKVYLTKERVELREQFTSIPRRLGPWTAVGPDTPMPKEVVETLGTDFYLNRIYERRTPDGQDVGIQLHIAYYTGMIDAIPHIPDRCLVAAGYIRDSDPQVVALDLDQHEWRIDPDAAPGAVHASTGLAYPVLTYQDRITRSPVRVHMPVQEPRVRVTRFQSSENPEFYIYAGFMFLANGVTTPSTEEVKLKAFNLTDKYAYYCKLQFTMARLPQDMTAEDYGQHVADLLNYLLPEVMRCLPDWAEIESRQAAAPGFPLASTPANADD